MSSFIVDDRTINSVACFLFDQSPNTVAALSKMGIATRPQDLAEEMYKLNIAAVESRYGEYSAGSMCDLNFMFKKVNPDNEIQALKSLRCWLYQCGEGNVPESKLYQIMDLYSLDLALSIVRKLPEYDAAQWG